MHSQATAAGEAKPFSLTGSLPIVADLKEAGFDVQICGFGNMEAYHANNEYGHLSGFEVGFRALAHVVVNLEK
jgi:acetylornithine deacetylase